MRAPWTAPDLSFSWTTLWLNLGCAIAVVRFLIGEHLVIGPVDWTPGALDGGTVAAMLGSLGGIYGVRRYQETTTPKIGAGSPG